MFNDFIKPIFVGFLAVVVPIMGIVIALAL